MIRDRLGAKPLVLQVPVGIESSLTGVVDLVKMKAQVWKNEALGAEWEYKDIPDDLKEISEKYRTELVETAVEQDEKLMEAYLNGDEIKEKEERVGRMLLMHANSREDIKEANAGDIVALAGLKLSLIHI